jgi:hypothetical protein
VAIVEGEAAQEAGAEHARREAAGGKVDSAKMAGA